MPPSPAYRPEPRFFDLGPDYADAVQAADFPQTLLRFRNDRAAAEVGLETLSEAEWIAAFGRFAPLPGLKNNEIKGQLMNPVLDSRQAETRVEVPHGSTLAFGGLRMARQIGREEKIPILGDVPGIGNLFKSKRKQKTMSDLYFFVTPHLVSR